MCALSRVLAYVLVSGGPDEQLANVRWPMHKALCELHGSAGRTGQLALLGTDLVLRSSPAAGMSVQGADAALDALVACSVLVVDGELREAKLVLDPGAAVPLRRELMRLAPEQVALYRRAGARWAALASTAAKNRSTALRSSASTVMSSTPKRA